MFNHLISGEDDEPDGRSRHNDWGKMLFSIASDYGDSFVSLLAPQQGTRINGSDAAVDYLASIGGTSYSYGAATAAPSSRNLITTDGADLLDSGEIHADTYYQYINGQIIADALNSPDESFSYDEVTLKASAVGATLADFVFHYDLSRCTEKWWSLVDDNGRMISVVSGSGIADIPFHLVNFDKANKKGAIRFRTDVSGNFDKTVRIYPALPSLNSMPEHSNGSEAVYPSTVLHYGYLNGTAFPIGRPWIDGTSNGLNGTITAFSDSIVETNEIAGLDAFSNFANDENYQEYISLTDIPTTVLPLSVLIVFKPNLLNSSQALFSLANGSSNVQQLKVETLNTNKVRAVHRNTSNANGAISTTDAQLDAWNHAAAEFTAATRSIWLNGTDKVTETAARTMFTATTCTFGAVDRDADDDLFFKGAIAAVEVRSGALSDEFVALHAKMFLAPDDVYESAVFRQVSGTIGEGRLVRRLVGRVSRGLTR